MNDVIGRFLEYVKFDTQSDDASGAHPSTEKQFALAERLASELRSLGVSDVRVTDKCYVFGSIPASEGCENAPVLGLIAHLDTAGEASGADVNPEVVPYSGGIVPLGDGSRVLDPAVFPALKNAVGKTLIVTGGTTLLGADDKAGVAEIVSACATVLAEKLPHGALKIAFTPDEEIGEGTLFFDVKSFGADYAYTCDGGAAGDIEFCNFNATLATFEITGVSVHPGSAKGIMKNASAIGVELASMFPATEVPEKTCNFEGFYHLCSFSGEVGHAKLVYLLRDHDETAFARRCDFVREAAARLNAEYGASCVKLTLKEQYRNMATVIEKHRFLLTYAEEAVRAAGLVPRYEPIRGGTDGATLSLRGLPCPNLGTGGYNFHGECEYAVVEEMRASVDVLLHLIGRFACRS